MVELLPPQHGRGPIPGGPFPRIGIPRPGERPATVLSRWLNSRDFPELYASPEVSPRDLEKRLRSEQATPHVRIRIADLACIQLRFREALPAYERLANSER